MKTNYTLFLALAMLVLNLAPAYAGRHVRGVDCDLTPASGRPTITISRGAFQADDASQYVSEVFTATIFDVSITNIPVHGYYFPGGGYQANSMTATLHICAPNIQARQLGKPFQAVPLSPIGSQTTVVLTATKTDGTTATANRTMDQTCEFCLEQVGNKLRYTIYIGCGHDDNQGDYAMYRYYFELPLQTFNSTNPCETGVSYSYTHLSNWLRQTTLDLSYVYDANNDNYVNLSLPVFHSQNLTYIPAGTYDLRTLIAYEQNNIGTIPFGAESNIESHNLVEATMTVTHTGTRKTFTGTALSCYGELVTFSYAYDPGASYIHTRPAECVTHTSYSGSKAYVYINGTPPGVNAYTHEDFTTIDLAFSNISNNTIPDDTYYIGRSDNAILDARLTEGDCGESPQAPLVYGEVIVYHDENDVQRFRVSLKDEFGHLWRYNYPVPTEDSFICENDSLPQLPIWDWNRDNAPVPSKYILDVAPILGARPFGACVMEYTYIDSMSITGVTALRDDGMRGSYKRNDRMYDVLVPNNALPYFSGQRIKMLLKDRFGTQLACACPQVPLILSPSSTTATRTVIMSDQVKNSANQPTRDVYICSGVTLQCSPGETSFRNIMLAPKGSLDVPEGATLNVQSLILVGKNDDVSSVGIRGTLNNASNKVVHMRDLDQNDPYFMSLPQDYLLTNVKNLDTVAGGLTGLAEALANGEDLMTKYQSYEHGVNFRCSYYDGAQRITNNGNSRNWKDYTAADTIKAGHGFTTVVTKSSNVFKRTHLGFILDYDYAAQAEKTIEVEDYGIDSFIAGSLTPNNVGWNLIGSSTLGDYNLAERPILYGKLIKGTHYYTLDPDPIPYITLPIKHGDDYVQQKAETVWMHPFTSYFVQIGDEKNGHVDDLAVSFSRSATMPYHAPQRVETTTPEQELVLQISKGNLSDLATLRIHNRFTDQYEFQADLAKRMEPGPYPYLYTISGSNLLAFNALPESSAQGSVPVGFYAPFSGSYTIALPDSINLPRIQAVFLTDHELNITTNLMLSPYTFTTPAMQNNTRFVVSCLIAPAQTPTSTTTSQNGQAYASLSGQTLRIFGLQAGERVTLYGATGQLVYDGTATSDFMQLYAPAPAYIIRLQNDDQVQTLRVVR